MPNIDEFSDPIDSFRGGGKARKDGCIWGCAPFVLGVLLGLLGPPIIWFTGKPEDRNKLIILIAGFSVLFALLGVAGLTRAVLIGFRVLRVCPEGLVWSGLLGRQAFLWEDVDELVAWPDLGTVFLLLRDGRRLSFYADGVDDASIFTKLVQRQVCKALAPGFIERIRKGETVECGRLQADEEGVTCRRGEYTSKKTPSFYKGPLPVGPDVLVGQARTCPKHKAKDFYNWEQLIGFEVDDGENQVYLVTPDGPEATGSTPRDVPNVAILIEAAQVMAGES